MVQTSAITAVVPALASACQVGEEPIRSPNQKNNESTVNKSAKW